MLKKDTNAEKQRHTKGTEVFQAAGMELGGTKRSEVRKRSVPRSTPPIVIRDKRTKAKLKF